MGVKLNFNDELLHLMRIVNSKKMETYMEAQKKWVIYLSGPMTGIPQFNYPAFKAAAAKLRALGYEVIDPTEIDDSHTQKVAMASTDGNAPMPWGQLIGRDIAILCGGAAELALLPGWENSRGSLMEALAARFEGLRVSEYTFKDNEHYSTPVPDNEIAECIEALLHTRSASKNVHQAHKSSLLQARS